MDTITEEQYRKVLKQYDEIVKLIIATEKYKVLFKQEQRKKEKEKTRKIAEDQKMKEEEIESFDKREYERLKAKFEGK